MIVWLVKRRICRRTWITALRKTLDVLVTGGAPADVGWATVTFLGFGIQAHRECLRRMVHSRLALRHRLVIPPGAKEDIYALRRQCTLSMLKAFDGLEEVTPARLAWRKVSSRMNMDRFRRRAIYKRLTPLWSDHYVALANDMQRMK